MQIPPPWASPPVPPGIEVAVRMVKSSSSSLVMLRALCTVAAAGDVIRDTGLAGPDSAFGIDAAAVGFAAIAAGRAAVAGFGLVAIDCGFIERNRAERGRRRGDSGKPFGNLAAADEDSAAVGVAIGGTPPRRPSRRCRR